jgi:hypothetical protein
VDEERIDAAGLSIGAAASVPAAAYPQGPDATREVLSFF